MKLDISNRIKLDSSGSIWIRLDEPRKNWIKLDYTGCGDSVGAVGSGFFFLCGEVPPMTLVG